MIYEPLLLNCGGGILSPSERAPQFAETGALCIGIGGIGGDALCDLKMKIHQQLEPDNPGEAVPRYDGIQLLAIDSDGNAISRLWHRGGLSDQEFFSIGENLLPLLNSNHARERIRNDPRMDWMEIDEIHCVAPYGAGGNRQMGRYMLIKKAAALYAMIQNKCHTLAVARQRDFIDVYLFAGLSGGTGGGCFLDVCYLVQKAAEAQGLDARIMGYFFLPEVMDSNPEIHNPHAVIDNNANGYAALKELDYLMNLRDNHDRFVQDYGNGVFVSSNRPPVDLCHLVSNFRADGWMVPDAYRYAINAASDYVLHFLAEVNMIGLPCETIRGHVNSITQGVDSIPRRCGANLGYTVLGASAAEIPMNQINTYLAAGFFRRFDQIAGSHRGTVSQGFVRNVIHALGFDRKGILSAVTAGSPPLNLPEIGPAQLAAMPAAPRGSLNAIWANYITNWQAYCNARMNENVSVLSRSLDEYTLRDSQNESLIGRVFCRLCALSADPDYGPYFAAELLRGGGYCLIQAVSEIIQEIEKETYNRLCQLDGIMDLVLDLNEQLIHRFLMRRQYYDRYCEAVRRWLQLELSVSQLRRAVVVLREFRDELEKLYHQFFNPLCQMLTDLTETFEYNAAFLRSPEARVTNAHMWQIMTVNDLSPRLDGIIDALTPHQLITDFADYLLRHSFDWTRGDQDRIALRIRAYMVDLFQAQADRTVRDYLNEQHPAAGGHPAALAPIVNRTVLSKAHFEAEPVFCFEPGFDHHDPTSVFETEILSVPRISQTVSMAATQFVQMHAGCHVRGSSINCRILALRFISGVPLFAYYGLQRLKADYDAVPRAGRHLYADTGRGGYRRNWNTYLPDPVPRSRFREPQLGVEEIASLYFEALHCGAIHTRVNQHGGLDYFAVPTPELVLPEYREADFRVHGVCSADRCADAIQQVESLYSRWRECPEEFGGVPVYLKNDGDAQLSNPEDVRIDHLIGSPVLQELVRQELDKRMAFEFTLAFLHNIYREAVGN